MGYEQIIHNTHNFRPTDKTLDACHCVTVADPLTSMREMKKWCWESGLGLIWAELVDTTDVSYNYDSVAAFYFMSAEDATVFRLRWL
jgi:hypothetical protein